MNNDKTSKSRWKETALIFCVLSTSVSLLGCHLDSSSVFQDLPQGAKNAVLKQFEDKTSDTPCQVMGRKTESAKNFKFIEAKKEETSAADGANGIEERWSGKVTYIYKCQNETAWRDSEGKFWAARSSTGSWSAGF